LAVCAGTLLEPLGKIVATDKTGKGPKLWTTPGPEKIVNFVKVHILDSINKSAMSSNPVANYRSVTSPLKHSDFKSPVVLMRSKIDSFITLTFKVVN